jgi:phage host-nuclease inhibitor protein Gam
VATEAEKKVILDAVQQLVRELFEITHSRAASERAKGARIAAIEQEYHAELAVFADRESDLKRQLAELLVPHFDELTEAGLEALIKLPDDYGVKRTRPESLNQTASTYTVMGSIEDYLKQSGDRSLTLQMFVTPQEPKLDKNKLKNKQYRHMLDHLVGVELVTGLNLLYSHGEQQIIDYDVHARGISA